MRPPLLKRRKNILYYLLLWSPYIAVYQVTNRFHLVEPRQLDFVAADKVIPFLPWMLPIYVSYLVYVFLFIYRSENDQAVTRVFLLSHFQLFVSVIFFVVFPVAFPIDLFYRQHDTLGIFAKFWLWFDAPQNCFPSLHSANTLLVMYLVSRSPVWSRWARATMMLWGSLVVLSTLTCKQHYLADVAAGLGVFGLTLLLSPRIERYLQWATSARGRRPSPPSESVPTH